MIDQDIQELVKLWGRERLIFALRFMRKEVKKENFAEGITASSFLLACLMDSPQKDLLKRRIENNKKYMDSLNGLIHCLKVQAPRQAGLAAGRPEGLRSE